MQSEGAKIAVERGRVQPMTALLEQALEKVQALPDEMQDQAARMLLAYAGGDELTRSSP